MNRTGDPTYNAGSIAVLAALAEDLSERYPRLESTSVTIAFFGRGRMGDGGVDDFAGRLKKKRNPSVPAYFIGLERVGRGGAHGYVLGDGIVLEAPYAERELMRAMGDAATRTTDRSLEIIREDTTNAEGFAERGYPTIDVTTALKAGGRGEIDRGQLLVTLQLLERTLSELDRPRLELPQPRENPG